MHIKEENLAQLEIWSPQLETFLREGRTLELLEGARKLLAVDPDDFNIRQVVARHLVDGGSDVHDLTAIQEGIELFEKILNESPGIKEELSILFRYNLSNAHGGRYHCFRLRDQNDLAEEALQAQKSLLQAILLRREHIPFDILPAVLTNYANVLDHLSRTFEAVDQYLDCIRVEPDHGVARGNCGEALQRVIAWSEQHRLENIQARWDLLSAAVESPDTVVSWAGPFALQDLAAKREQARKEIEQYLKQGLSTLEDFRKHRLEDHSSPAPEPWLQEALADRLLLTFNQLPLNSQDEAQDDLYFDTLRYGMSEEDKRRSIDLIYILNSVKEEFVSARYLYYHAKNEQKRLSEMNSITHYGDPEGSAEFGLISGLLKTSFRLSIDLLDKIAAFLVLYFDLGDPSQNYNFNNVWYQNRDAKKGIIHPKLAARLQDNYPLRGLRDLQNDFYLQKFPGNVKEARNAAVHRWLTLSWLPVERGKGRGASWNLEDFFSVTLFLLRQAKGAILSLVATINVEERRRKSENTDPKKVVVPTPLFVRKPISARATEEIEEEEISEDKE